MLNNLLAMFAVACTEEEKATGAVDTALFGCYKGGIMGVLAIVLKVMIFLAGAAGVIGIIISGIQYATASGDPAQVTKAKRRIIEIVIGLVAMGLMYAFLSWLIPGFSF